MLSYCAESPGKKTQFVGDERDQLLLLERTEIKVHVKQQAARSRVTAQFGGAVQRSGRGEALGKQGMHILSICGKTPISETRGRCLRAIFATGKNLGLLRATCNSTI